MAIEWPGLSQGASIGTKYNSDDGYVWTWNGKGWDGTLGNSLRGYPSPWVIFNNGIPTCYRNLNDAMSAAVTGETIHLYGNSLESPTGIVLKNGVDINLNGNTYVLDGSAFVNHGFINNSGVVNVKIYNGVIRYENDDPSFFMFYNNVAASTFLFEGCTFNTNSSICGVFKGSVEGGEFYSISNVGFLYNGSILSNNVIRNVYASSVSNVAVSINDTSVNCDINFINLIAQTAATDLEGTCILAVISAGRLNFHDCTGISTSSAAGFEVLSSTTGSIRLKNCYGVSTGGIGIVCQGAELIDCVGEGLSIAFDNKGNCDLYGCSDSMLRDSSDESSLGLGSSLRLETGIYTGVTMNIENCAFTQGIYSTTNSLNSNTINIKNCTIRRGSAGGIQLTGENRNTIINIENCVIGNNEVAANAIVVSGATGGKIINNTMLTNGTGLNSISYNNITTNYSKYIAGNAAIGSGVNQHPQLITNNSSTKGNLFY